MQKDYLNEVNTHKDLVKESGTPLLPSKKAITNILNFAATYRVLNLSDEINIDYCLN